MKDKEKMTAWICSLLLRESLSLRGALAEGSHCVSAEHKQSFFVNHKYSINDCLAGFNGFLNSLPFFLREEEHIEPKYI